jgi:hypothetical protein
MKIFLFTVIILVGTVIKCNAQIKEAKPSKFFFSTGFGLGGNFFVRDYDEALPFPSSEYKSFFKKNFIGTVQEVSAGIHLKKGIDLNFGYSRQRFTRKVIVEDNLPSNVSVLMDLKIHHVDNIWFGGLTKNYSRRKNIYSWGSGIFWLRAQQQEGEIYTGYVIFRERKLEDGGAYVQLAYEYRYQPKVHIGLKGQFFWILSGSYPESVALAPYIKLDF